MPNNITIADLEIQITSNTSQAVDNLTRLETALLHFKGAVRGGIGLTSVTNQLKAFNDAVKGMPKLTRFEQLRDILAQIKGIGNINIGRGVIGSEAQQGNAAIEAKSSLEAVADTSLDNVSQATDDIAEGIEEATENYGEFKEELESLDLEELNTFEETIDRIDEKIELLQERWGILSDKLAETDDAEKANRIQLQLNSIEETLAKLQKRRAKLIEDNEAKKLKAAQAELEKTTKDAKDLGNEAKKSSSFLGKLLKSFGRIALYRAVRSIIKSFTKDIKEGITNLYQFSKESGGGFASSMDKIATALLSFRNSIAVILQPILNVVAPAIEAITDKFMKLANAISKAGAIMNGQSTFTKATKSLQEYAEAAKQAQTATQGFDALNIAGKNTPNYNEMFQEVSISEDTQDTATAFGEILKDLKEIIGELATTLMPILRDIAGAIMPIIQDLLGNTFGFIKQIMPALEEILGKIGEIIATLLDKLQPVLDQLTNSGTSQILDDIMQLVGIIVNILVPILDTIFELLAPIGDLIGAIMDVVASIIHSVVQTLAPVIKQIGELLQPIIELIVNILKPVLEWLVPILQTIAGIIQVITDVFSTALNPAIETMKLLWKGFMSFFSGDSDLIKKTWSEVGDHLKDIWSNAWDAIKRSFVNVINKIVDGFEKFVNALIDGLNWVTDKMSQAWTWAGIPAIPQISHKSFNRLEYASGGYGIPRGQLFIANEAGAEMVGSMDGKTAVANNQQIVEGIKQGVYEAMINAQSQEGGDKAINLNVYLSGKQLKAEYDRLTTASGVRLATGGII